MISRAILFGVTLAPRLRECDKMPRLHGGKLGFLHLEGSVTMAAALDPQFEDRKWWLVLRRFSLEGFGGCCMVCGPQGQRASAGCCCCFSFVYPPQYPCFSSTRERWSSNTEETMSRLLRQQLALSG